MDKQLVLLVLVWLWWLFEGVLLCFNSFRSSKIQLVRVVILLLVSLFLLFWLSGYITI